jgi:hypothetical protein
MAVHGHTIAWGTHLGRATQGSRGHWFQRLRHWLSGGSSAAVLAPASTYSGWNNRRERYQVPAAASALEYEAARGGQSWLVMMHSTTV